MARKRTELGPDVDRQIAALTRRGGTAESIAATLSAAGVAVSPSTIGRRMRELRGPVAAPRAIASSKASSPLPRAAVDAIPEDVPENTPLGQLDAWLEQVTEAIDKVAPGAVDENLPLFGQLIARAAALSETRRKATPPAPPDPNENPDLRRLAKDVVERLHRMVDLVAS